MVPGVGVEPTRIFKIRGILNPLCLPISPPGLNGGADRSRTDLDGFAIHYITALLPHRGAGNGTRTRDINLGKVALYQLSYSRRQV